MQSGWHVPAKTWPMRCLPPPPAHTLPPAPAGPAGTRLRAAAARRLSLPGLRALHRAGVSPLWGGVLGEWRCCWLRTGSACSSTALPWRVQHVLCMAHDHNTPELQPAAALLMCSAHYPHHCRAHCCPRPPACSCSASHLSMAGGRTLARLPMWTQMCCSLSPLWTATYPSSEQHTALCWRG
jgi:hypothetical protein